MDSEETCSNLLAATPSAKAGGTVVGDRKPARLREHAKEGTVRGNMAWYVSPSKEVGKEASEARSHGSTARSHVRARLGFRHLPVQWARSLSRSRNTRAFCPLSHIGRHDRHAKRVHLIFMEVRTQQKRTPRLPLHEETEEKTPKTSSPWYSCT